jgi:hypothetical protein
MALQQQITSIESIHLSHLKEKPHEDQADFRPHDDRAVALPIAEASAHTSW